MHIKAVMLWMCLEVLGGGFLFSWGLGRGLWDFVVSSKAVPEVLDMKYRSEFTHGFTNCGCLHCAILKALHDFQEKRVHKSRGKQFLFQNVQNEISRFSRCLKTT